MVVELELGSFSKGKADSKGYYLQAFDQITLTNDTQSLDPDQLSFFFSSDKLSWSKMPLLFSSESGNSTVYSFPLIRSRWLQIILYNEGKAIPEKISGSVERQSNIKIKSSGSKNRLWVSDNLIDGREDYGWETVPGMKENDSVFFDLNKAYFMNAISLRSVKEMVNDFPTNFIIKLSLDQKHWVSVVEESNFLAGSFRWYQWKFLPARARYIQITILKLENKKHRSVKILDIDIMAKPENEILSSFFEHGAAFSYASELIAGSVKFAEHNATYPLKAVQSSDPRLRKGSTDYPGIVQLTRDGQDTKGFVVQGNDSRLKEATTEYSGIIELASDGENTPGVAVQGSDSRLKYATHENAGVVRLAKNGESSPNSVVQGNDNRLRISSTQYPGIVQFAQDGASLENVALQSSDSRLRKASTQWHGIVQLAGHNEVSRNKALQADDPRIARGTEEKKGVVQFAKDKEAKAFKAIQSNDSRLYNASEESSGIVRLARSGQKESGSAVQANDPRLDDARTALPHSHDYASKDHLLNSHTGGLNLKSSKDTPRSTSYSIPHVNNYPLSSENSLGLSAAFLGGIAVGSDHDHAVDSYSKSNTAVRGRSREKPACIFFSEKAYALHLPSRLDGLSSSGKAIFAEGDSIFKGRLLLERGMSVTIQYHDFMNETFAEGDLLTVNENGKVRKMRSNHEPFIGSFTNDPHFCLSASHGPKFICINISGIAKMRIKDKIEAGNWVGYLDDEPGVGRKVSQIQKQHGFAIAMESSAKEIEKLILCLIKR